MQAYENYTNPSAHSFSSVCKHICYLTRSIMCSQTLFHSYLWNVLLITHDGPGMFSISEVS